MWLNKLKSAIITKNIKELELLMDELPSFEKKEDIDSGLYLLEEAKNIVSELKNETQLTMIQIKKNIDFMKSTQTQKTAKFDIIS